MEKCLVTFMTQTTAYRFKKTAKINGYNISIVQTPKEISYGGCSYCAKCECRDILGLLEICRRDGLSYSRVFKEGTDARGRKFYREM